MFDNFSVGFGDGGWNRNQATLIEKILQPSKWSTLLRHHEKKLMREYPILAQQLREAKLKSVFKSKLGTELIK